jgi:hypothetical protein
MTNKMKLIFVIATTASAVFSVLSTPFAVDIADQILSAIANALGLYEAPALSALAVLVIPGLYLYLALTQTQRRYL